MKIPLVDLQVQYSFLKEQIDPVVGQVIEAGQYVMGPEVKAFEKEMAAYLGSGYAVGVASGTDALLLALLACGIGPGDEVITTPFTFIATSEVIDRCGARPVFVDIDSKTYNIDPTRIEAKITNKTKAILPVHLYGQSADMDPIMELAHKYGLKVIEDCAQALGSQYRGQKVGTIGDAGCLSFFPSKMLGCYGDGGMVVTNSAEIAEKVELLHNHGTKQKYYHSLLGLNSRLDSLQAAVLRVKLTHLDGWIEQRRRIASLYAGLLDGADGVIIPFEAPYTLHVYNYYTIRLRSKRNECQKILTDEGISTAIYYPLSLHLQEVYQHLGYRPGSLPQSERAQEETISLPMYPELGEEQINAIASAILSFLRGVGVC